MQALHSDRLVKVPCSAHVTVFMNFMAIELKKYLPLAEWPGWCIPTCNESPLLSHKLCYDC